MAAEGGKSSSLKPNPRFGKVATEAQLKKAAEQLEAHGFHAILAPTKEAALQAVRQLLPEGAEVMTATSRTLETLGLAAEIDQSGRYHSVRARVLELAKRGDKAEQRRIGQAPDWIVGSVHAVTEDGQVLVASATGSQVGPYAYGAAHVVWVVGAQKVVPSLEAGLERLREYSLPLEDARALEAYGMNSGLNKILILSREAQPGRVTIILVHADLGF